MPNPRSSDDWDAAFDAAMGWPNPGTPEPEASPNEAAPADSGLRALDAELDGLDDLASAFARLDARAEHDEGTPRFQATFRKLTSGTTFGADELAAVLEMAAYSLTEMGELRLVERHQDDAMTWTVTYAIIHAGPMAEMVAGPVGGVMAAWRGRLPVPHIGLIEAEGKYLG